jgi:hypothetical protein
MTWAMVAKKIAAKLHGRLSERPHLIPSPETDGTSTKGPPRDMARIGVWPQPFRKIDRG